MWLFQQSHFACNLVKIGLYYGSGILGLLKKV